MQVQKARQGYKLVKSLFDKYEEIPVDWGLEKLEQISVINPEQITENYKQNEIKYIDISSIENYRIIKYEKIKFGERPSRAQRITHQNDVLVSMVRPYLHGFAKVLDNDKNLICSTGFVVIRSKSIEDVNFIFNYVKSHPFEKNFIRQMEGMAYPAITSSVVSESLIPVPNNIMEREKIGNILSNVDALIDQTRKIIEQTQRLKKGLMQKLLTRGIGHTKFKKVKSLFGKYEEIPEYWNMEKFDDLGEPVIGLTYDPEDVKSEGILVLRAPNIHDGELRFDDNVYVDVKLTDKLKIRKGDLLICVRNGSKRLIGKCAYVNRNFENMTFGAFMSVFRSLSNQFLYYQFQMPIIRKQITKSLTFTINQITNKDLKSFIVPLPPKPEQQKITSILSNVDSQIQKHQEYKSTLETLKKGLMQKLLTGQIRVKV